MYRIEVWLHPSINSEEAVKSGDLETMKEYLKNNFGSEVEDKPIEVTPSKKNNN